MVAILNVEVVVYHRKLCKLMKDGSCLVWELIAVDIILTKLSHPFIYSFNVLWRDNLSFSSSFIFLESNCKRTLFVCIFINS